MIIRRGNLIHKQRTALIEALERYGYTCVGSPSLGGYRYDATYLVAMNPYDVLIDGDDNGKEALLILHRSCTDCWGSDPIVHEIEFLQAMIPVIGRLDAQAHYDPCEPPGRSPRLWIYL